MSPECACPDCPTFRPSDCWPCSPPPARPARRSAAPADHRGDHRDGRHQGVRRHHGSGRRGRRHPDSDHDHPGGTARAGAGPDRRTHGSETAPIIDCSGPRLVTRGTQGTLLIVHVANLPSYLGRTIYYSPIDGKNLNRVYPGSGTGRCRNGSPTPSPARSSSGPTTWWTCTPATATRRSGPTLTGTGSASTRRWTPRPARWRWPGAMLTSSWTPPTRDRASRSTPRTPRISAASGPHHRDGRHGTGLET